VHTPTGSSLTRASCRRSAARLLYLFSTCIHPGEGFDRYLVRRTVASRQVTPGEPQVHLALWRYFFVSYDRVTTSMVALPTEAARLHHDEGAWAQCRCTTAIGSWNDHGEPVGQLRGRDAAAAPRLIWSGPARAARGNEGALPLLNAANTNHLSRTRRREARGWDSSSAMSTGSSPDQLPSHRSPRGSAVGLRLCAVVVPRRDRMATVAPAAPRRCPPRPALVPGETPRAPAG
jgi:hypothetical protein